jgi:hypothetical protein
MVAGEFVGG